ncbi:MAG: DNA repair protein RecN [Gammaproteobacteria bacterium]|nr:DNA repair protein RecN [Gammaproteobacteria bacterium]
MLSRLQIKDLAIVANLAADFRPGMTALTGETGAGKSVLIDALGLALGDRADNGMIRGGRARAEVTAVFDVHGAHQARDWLRSRDLDAEEECILRRLLVRDGQSRAFVNGTPVPLKLLQELGALLVDIHSQHAHQSLLRPEQQRELLDEYAGNRAVRDEVGDLYRQWQQAESTLAEARKNTLEYDERLDLLRFQSEELTALGLTPGEAEAIDREQRMLSHAVELGEQCGAVLRVLAEDEESVRTRLTRSVRSLEAMLKLAPELRECGEMLETAVIQVEEAAAALRRFADGIELNPERLEQVEQRLSDLHDLARKYRCAPEDLPERLRTIQNELRHLERSGIRADELEVEKERLRKAYYEQAERLGATRDSAAGKLAESVSNLIASLGMPDGRVRILVEKLPSQKASPTGLERVEFQFSANPGQPLQPLNRVASGGELSRISLAIQVATLQCGLIPTLIFDEVDVGIGGGIAEIIGRMLRQLGAERQVLCVTHLPQVASQGQDHLLISKHSQKQEVTTEIIRLQGESRIEEVARMLGGVKITTSTLAHAREMISLAAD